MSEVSLNVKGKKFEGWTSVSIEKSLYQMTGTFGFAGTNIFPGNAEKWGLALGDECTVLIDDQIIITGYIEDIPISYDAVSHNIQISGRDKTGDLVDCSFAETNQEWKGQKIITVIKALCNPFGISVDVDNSVSAKTYEKTPKDLFKINPGETVFDAIFRLCKPKGILPVSYGDGQLVLTGTGTQWANDILELGKNVKSGSINQSDKERFSTYIVKGQGENSPFGTVEDAAHAKGAYHDLVLMKSRPARKIVIWPESSCTVKYCQDLAKWECVNRAGNSRSIDYEVQNWVQSNGKVWPLNALVKVKDHFLQINTAMLIAAVNFTMNNESGTITKLALVHPKTFELPPTNPTEEMTTGFDWAKLN
ncbi:MAG: hypothetical protein JRJ76_06785 [Deltaproteobacteria bacterium]|nr:hypothetical protein [Deltaproteobacteria bacterium]